MFICSMLEAFKHYIYYIVSRAGGVDRRAMLTKKSNFEKGIFNRNAEEKKAMHNEIQSINSIIDAPPPRAYI